jgi:hypothetical protein
MRKHHGVMGIRDRQGAARNLVMQYRVERAVRRMGKVALLLLPLIAIVMIAGIFVKRYM